MNKDRLTRKLTTLAVVGVVVVAMDRPGLTQEASTINVDDPRPLANAIRTLENRHGVVITYEDPPYVHASQVAYVTNDVAKGPTANGIKVLVPRGGSFDFTYALKARASPAQMTGILERLVAAHGLRDYPGAFKVERAGEVFHIVPTMRRNENRNEEPYRSILDRAISIARTAPALEVLKDIAATLTARSGATVILGTMPTQQLVRGDLTVASPVTLNEPVTLRLSLRNGSPYPLQVDLGFDREGAFEFELTKPDGTKQSIQRGVHLLVGDTVSRLPRFTVPAGRDYGQTILLSELLSFSQAGAYTLRVRFGGSIAGTSDSSSALPRTSTFSIVVLPRDEARLDERLREVSSRFALPKGSDGFSDAVDELASIKDPVAIPYLEAATEREISPKFCETLRLIGTPAAKQALERLSAHRTAWVAQAAKNARSRMK